MLAPKEPATPEDDVKVAEELREPSPTEEIKVEDTQAEEEEEDDVKDAWDAESEEEEEKEEEKTKPEQKTSKSLRNTSLPFIVASL